VNTYSGPPCRRYNLPTTDEVAAIVPGDGTQTTAMHNIILHHRDGPLHRINDCHPAYACLHYTLLFPYGEHGWHLYLLNQDLGNENEDEDHEGGEGASEHEVNEHGEPKTKFMRMKFMRMRFTTTRFMRTRFTKTRVKTLMKMMMMKATIQK
jgi:hypothetical protein